MAYIVFLLGLILAGCGGYVLYLGFDDLTTERGLALTMSGTVAFSIGLAVLSIGFAVLALGRIGRKLDALRLDSKGMPVALEPAEIAPVAAPPAHEADAVMLDAVENAVMAGSVERPRLPIVSDRPSAADGHAPGHAHDAGMTLAGATALGAAGTLIAGTSLSRTATAKATETLDEGEAAADASTGTAAARLAATHAEIDRLIEELASDTADKPIASLSPAKSGPTTDAGGAFESDLLRELGRDAARAAGPGAEETQRHGDDTHDTDRPPVDAPPEEPMAAEATPHAVDEHHDRYRDDLDEALVPLEPIRDDGGHEARAEAAHSGEGPAPALIEHEPQPGPDELVHLEPVGDDEASSSLREGMHQVAPADEEVIGSYESGGVTYTLYGDGSVVAAAGEQRERYPSLEALRTAFEQGESVFSV